MPSRSRVPVHPTPSGPSSGSPVDNRRRALVPLVDNFLPLSASPISSPHPGRAGWLLPRDPRVGGSAVGVSPSSTGCPLTLARSAERQRSSDTVYTPGPVPDPLPVAGVGQASDPHAGRRRPALGPEQTSWPAAPLATVAVAVGGHRSSGDAHHRGVDLAVGGRPGNVFRAARETGERAELFGDPARPSWRKSSNPCRVDRCAVRGSRIIRRNWWCPKPFRCGQMRVLDPDLAPRRAAGTVLRVPRSG